MLSAPYGVRNTKHTNRFSALSPSETTFLPDAFVAALDEPGATSTVLSTPIEAAS